MTDHVSRLKHHAARPRVGLALSGGAARGFAHVGVLRALKENQIPIDCIAGTSAGALVGGAYAAGLSTDRIEAIGRRLRLRDMGRVTILRRGIQSNQRLEEYLRARLPLTRFEDLPVPFAAIATDLHSGAPVVMRGEGDLAFAIRASCCVPGWYVPVKDGRGKWLVDGGLSANIPSLYARELGADVVIAVDVNSEGAKFFGPPRTVIGVLFQTIMVVARNLAAHQLKDADIIISPKIGHIRWDETKRADELLAAGYEAAQESMERIRELIH
jgi:NTE family protein